MVLERKNVDSRLVKASSIDSNHNPGVWQERIGLFKRFDVFVSIVGQSVWCSLGYIYYMGGYFEFAMMGYLSCIWKLTMVVSRWA